jgi:hypothetical protein
MRITVCPLLCHRSCSHQLQVLESASCPKSLPCGLFVGKSLMLIASAVVSGFRPPNGRSFGK